MIKAPDRNDGLCMSANTGNTTNSLYSASTWSPNNNQTIKGYVDPVVYDEPYGVTRYDNQELWVIVSKKYIYTNDNGKTLAWNSRKEALGWMMRNMQSIIKDSGGIKEWEIEQVKNIQKVFNLSTGYYPQESDTLTSTVDSETDVVSTDGSNMTISSSNGNITAYNISDEE